MYLCAHNHDEICYENSPCPLCVMSKEKDKEIDCQSDLRQSLETQMYEITGERDDLKASVRRLECEESKLNALCEKLRIERDECLAANPVAQHTHELEKGKNVW